ncbi:MAG: EFR1 family ferrodoxin [Anaerolineae bacterium]|nr:EFR1 family ferrodoxin [Anaerolineae bacterium]
MIDLKIAIVFFSATDVTRTYAKDIQEELHNRGCKAQLINVTTYASRQESLPVDDFDGFIFGFPVFGDFAPSVINEWLPMLDGKGKKCATFFTYGARTTGYAHFHTKLLLEEAGFRVQFTAEFLGRHSFNVAGWRVLPHRPDERDFVVAREFAALAIERFASDTSEVFRLQKPFRYDQTLELMKQQQKSAERGWTHPVRAIEECQMCRLCETECPTQAFDADTGLSDPLTCIKCMHCIYICPDKALKVDERMKDAYNGFLNDCHLTEEMMDAKMSKIITEARQAAF